MGTQTEDDFWINEYIHGLDVSLAHHAPCEPGHSAFTPISDISRHETDKEVLDPCHVYIVSFELRLMLE
jgi:hypothetical protein